MNTIELALEALFVDPNLGRNAFAPMTLGEVLKNEFLAEYGLSQNWLAKAIGILPNRIAEIVNNRWRIRSSAFATG